MKIARCRMPGARTAESAVLRNIARQTSLDDGSGHADKAVRAPTGSPAFTIIECLVYVGLFVLLLGLGTVAFYRCFDNMKGLRRNADDITRAVQAGELWRNDIRAAARAIQTDDAQQMIRIPQRDRDVFYKFGDAQVFRRTGADAPWLPLLGKVQNSQMISDPHPRVTAWRWELELQAVRKDARLRPLFTFVAVPDPGNPP